MKRHAFITTNVRPSAAGHLVRGSGARVTDSNGKRYVDLTSQTLNMSLGHDNTAVKRSVTNQLKKLWFASSRFGTGPFIKLSRLLVKLAPEGIGAVNLKLTNGSDAVETAVKVARLYTREHTVVCIKNAWHGESATTLGYSSAESKKSYLVTETGVVFSREPTLESLLDTIAATTQIAAVLLDPVGVSSGLFTEKEARTYLPLIRQLCSERGIVLIYDEIQTFGGYLGSHLFATDYFGVRPDIICLGKSLGAGLPLAATLFSDDLRGVLDYNNAEYTYGGQALACAASMGALQEYLRREEEFAKRCLQWQDCISEHFKSDSSLEVRSFGFITTLTRAESRFRDVWASEVERQALKAGFIVRKNDRGRRILLKPPLVIESEDMERACASLRKIMSAAERTILANKHGLIIKKDISGKNRNEWYADALLRTLGPGFGAKTNTAIEQHMLSERLNELGIPAVRVYADDTKHVAYAFQVGVSGNTWLRTLRKDDDFPEAVAYFIRQQNAVELAHDHGIIIGDRWPGNTVIKGGYCIFVDYDVSYEGDFETLSAFEELFCLFQSLAHVGSPALADRIAGPLVRGILRRHGEMAKDVWNKLFFFYTDPRKVKNASSLPAAVYRRTALMVAKHIEVSPRAMPHTSSVAALENVKTPRHRRQSVGR